MIKAQKGSKDIVKIVTSGTFRADPPYTQNTHAA